jgi:hypothetical protein
MYTENEKTIRNRCMDRLGVRWAGNNGYNRNVKEIIPALSRNTAGTVIIDEGSDRSASYAQEEEVKNEKCLYCDWSRMNDGYVGAGLTWKVQENERNWEWFNGESYQLGDNKEVYDAELDMQRRDLVQVLRILRFLDSQAALHRIKNDKKGPRQPFQEWSIGGSETYPRKSYH